MNWPIEPASTSTQMAGVFLDLLGGRGDGPLRTPIVVFVDLLDQANRKAMGFGD